jgi:potassium/hydrogen antiporter
VTEGAFILVAGGLLAATTVAAVVASSLRVPSLVLFLLVGMAAGSDGAGWVDLDNYALARQIGTVALSLILFEGGLSASFGELRAVLRPALGLALIGTLTTAVVTGLAACVLLGLPVLQGLLLGSVLASTDGAAVFALLRGSSLRRRLVLTLEGEAGFNDPVAVLLVVGFIAWLTRPGHGPIDMVSLLASELVVGLVAGVLVGRAGAALMRRATLPSAGLSAVATVAVAATAFGLADTLHGSGLLAVYVSGLALSSVRTPADMAITIFHQGVAWCAQAALFLTLGLLVFPSRLGGVLAPALALSVVLVLVARPLAVVLGTALSPFSDAERLILSWAGLRGGGPALFATFPVIAEVPGSVGFFDVVFVVVVVSTLMQGTTIEPLARRLGMTEDAAAPAARTTMAPWEAALGDPDHPVRLADAAVVAHVSARRDAPGALVVLDDGRHAITGATLAVGDPAELARYAEQRRGRAADAGERRWWTELSERLAVVPPRD